MKKEQIYIIVLGLICLVIAIVGFIVAGSPVAQKYIRFDETRLNNFRDLTYIVDNYYYDKKVLPNSLSDLSGTASRTDPETKLVYEYKKGVDGKYSLCTNFSNDYDTFVKNSNYGMYAYPKGENKINFKKGYSCIEYTVNNYQKEAVVLNKETLDNGWSRLETDQNFSFSYPNDWIFDKSNDQVVLFDKILYQVTLTKKDYTQKPPVIPRDTWSPYYKIIIYVEDNPKNLSTRDFYLNSYIFDEDDRKIAEKDIEEIMIDGTIAIKYPNEDTVLITGKNKAYIFAYSATDGVYEKYIDTFNKIVQSFQFTK